MFVDRRTTAYVDHEIANSPEHGLKVLWIMCFVTKEKMVPPIDTSQARKCLLCNTIKEPGEFKTARKCIECVAAVATADAEAYKAANLPAGTIMTAEDILAAPWTITELKDKIKIKQGFVKLVDLGPDFLNGVVAATTDAKITDAASKTAHKQKSKESVSFCSVPWCLKHLGLKQCSKCPPENNVRRLGDFNPRDGYGNPRGECKDCQHDGGASRRAALNAANASAAAQGETRLCEGPCGKVKSVAQFEGNRKDCNSCRSHKFEEGQKAKAAAKPDEYKFCSGSRVARPLEAFTEGLRVSDQRRDLDRVKDAKPQRRAYKAALNARKKYYQDWRDKQMATRPAEYLAHNAEVQRQYYAENKEIIMAQQKCRPSAQLNNCKNGALYRRIQWTISDDDAIALIKSPCFYSGIYEPEVHTTGIDRVDSSGGYVKDNVVPCNGFVNIMKECLDAWTFVELCAKVADGEDDNDIERMRARFKACETRKMKAPMPFEELCAAIAGHFDPQKLP